MGKFVKPQVKLWSTLESGIGAPRLLNVQKFLHPAHFYFQKIHQWHVHFYLFLRSEFLFIDKLKPEMIIYNFSGKLSVGNDYSQFLW